MKSSIFNILLKATQKLKSNIIKTPRLDAEVILASILKKDRIYLHLERDKKLSEDAINEFNKKITERIQGRPVAYIVGKQEFMGLVFNVDERVLIPRPDTEILVEAVIDYCNNFKKDLTILEIGTGSGAIAVSLAKYISNCFVHTVDISSEALTVARENARLNEVNNKIQFHNSNIFEALEFLRNKVDIIVSNPPYIPAEDIESLQIEVSSFEPKLALDGGKDGLYFYNKIIQEGINYLKENAMLAFEVGYDQSKLVTNIMKNKGYRNIEIKKDLSSIDRVVMGIKG